VFTFQNEEDLRLRTLKKEDDAEYLESSTLELLNSKTLI
jgi:hypothetical protein